jgi:hypothetical protein
LLAIPGTVKEAKYMNKNIVILSLYIGLSILFIIFVIIDISILSSTQNIDSPTIIGTSLRILFTLILALVCGKKSFNYSKKLKLNRG